MEKIIKELTSTLNNGINNIDKVVEGAVGKLKDNLNLVNEDEKAVINFRKYICDGCEFNSKNKVGYTSIRIDEHCTLCLCNLDWKQHCLSCNCGIEEYNKNASDDNKLNLKWFKIKDEK